MELNGGDGERIANALGPVLEIPLMRDWVQVSKSRVAGQYKITVVTEDVMAKVRPYVDTPEWTSITEPAFMGYELGRRPCYLPLNKHGMITGKSGSGKSSWMNTYRAHLTRCQDALWWGGGTQKVYDGYAGWIDPYLDTDLPLPIDWLASGFQDTLNMLIAAMSIVRFRQRMPMSRRGGWPKLIVEIDEASFALPDRTTRGVFEGAVVTIGDLVTMVSRAGRSAGVWVVVASQSGMPAEWGPQGNVLIANMNWRAVFQSFDEAEVGRALGWKNYKVEQPRFVGQCWLRRDDDEPQLIKSLYLQSTDPDQPRLHDELTVADVAWSRRDRRVQLDAGSVAAAGAAYARRHTRMNAAMMEYLTGCPTPETDHPERPPIAQGSMPDTARAAYAQAMAEVAALRPPGSDTAPTAGVASLARHKSRAERVMEIVCAAAEPMTAGEIVGALREAGDSTAQEPAVRAQLSKLVAGGGIQQPDRGRYAAR